MLIDDDELDLTLTKIDAGIRLLSYLHDLVPAGERSPVANGEAFVLEALMLESHRARELYEKGRGPSGSGN